MATIDHVRKNTNNARTILATWSDMAFGDVGNTLPFSQYADKSVQVIGTFGVGGSLVIEGSNDGVNFATLTDVQGNDLNFLTAKIETVTEATLVVRPRVAGGDGSTSISVILLARE